MAAATRFQALSAGCGFQIRALHSRSLAGRPFSSSSLRFTTAQSPPTPRANDEVARLAASRRRPLTLADLLKHGRPPLSKDALLASANFTLSLLPARLASRIEALRNLPFIVVANPHVSKIYGNYAHSLSTLLPWQKRQVTTLEEENQFADVLADLVHTHANTIPILARGFLECRRYIDPADVTRFLDTHLRARIGTRLIAEQHLALHFASQPVGGGSNEAQASRKHAPPSNYIGVIDTALQPARIVRTCEEFVGEICELKYGVRPRLEIDGEPDATFAYVPVHVEYILTELLKNAFRAVIESGNEREPIEVTIAAAPDVPSSYSHDSLARPSGAHGAQSDSDVGFYVDTVVGTADANESIKLSTPSSQSITIRIRDRGGGISPEILPHIWSYSFTTFSDLNTGEASGIDALNTISSTSGQLSSIAGLGYGLPLSRAYAEYFGGSIAVQSLWGWGTDVYLTLQERRLTLSAPISRNLSSEIALNNPPKAQCGGSKGNWGTTPQRNFYERLSDIESFAQAIVPNFGSASLVGSEKVYTASFAFFEALWEAGVTHCFVNLGSDHPSILEAMVKGQKEKPDEFPKIITCPNEMVAMSMADGYARLTGKPQCVIVHVDVGTQGLGAAVHNASCGRAPVLIFAGLSPFTAEGEMRGSRTEYIHWIQDVPDQKQIVAQYCRYAADIRSGKNVKQMVHRALQFATSDPKGPVYLVGAREVMEEEIEPYTVSPYAWKGVAPSALPAEGVELIATELAAAREPLVIVGYSGRDARGVKELVRLADTFQGVRVLDTGGSDMCFPGDHPASLGMRYGLHDAIETADFILVADCDVPWIPTRCKPSDSAKIIHVDVDPLKQQMPVFYLSSMATFRAESATAFKQINEYVASNERLKQVVGSEENTARGKRREEEFRRARQSVADLAVVPAGGDNAALNASYLMGEVRKGCPADTLWAIEAVTLTPIVSDQIAATIPNSWINCGGGGLGWSGGGALGIKLATDFEHRGSNKGKFVCQVVGDGTFLFSVPGSVYWIARRYNIPILTIVLNNKGWNAPRKSMLLVHPNGDGSRATNEDLNISFAPTPDYPGIAKAASGGHIWAGRAATVAELAKLLPEAVQSVLSGMAAVLEAQLDGTEK
ncbi:putative thiamine pyrophosphate enzyme [Aspergillus lucknowensis]|uniref:Protein-serine/threonine kinase n=1 Tax=Aspergillus lucknowensis TaxID=176173 RepID=A0ABR4LAE3_9EURO